MVQTIPSPAGRDLMCIVYHDSKLPRHHSRQLKLNLLRTFHYTQIFTNAVILVNYLEHYTFIANKLIIIVSGDEAEYVCGIIDDERQSLQDPFVYELQFDKKTFKSELSNDRRFESVDELRKKIDDDIRDYAFIDNDESDCQEDAFVFGIYDTVRKQESFSYLSREELKFKLFQSFLEVLLGIENDENEALKQMWISCRERFNNQNDYEGLRKVDEFQRDYDSANPVRLYSKSSFLFRFVNEVLRCEDFEKIVDFQPFITHIHQQLVNLRPNQSSTSESSRNMLYRGKKLAKSVIQQLEDNKNKLISINGFLSTTRSDNVAQIFAGTGANRPGYHSVVFEMDLNGINDSKRPYADISEVAEIFDEEEVLFFMGFVWRIQAVEKLSDDQWKITLKLSNDMDSELTQSFNHLGNPCSFFQLGKILHELGEYKNAICFYERMLKLTSDTSDKKIRADIHSHIATSAIGDESWPQALYHLNEAERYFGELKQSDDLDITEIQPVLAEDTPFSLMNIFINKALVYQKIRDYRRARESLEEALQQHGSQNETARVHYNFGRFLVSQGTYPEARNRYHQALQLTKDQNFKDNINQNLKNLDRISPP